MSAGKNQSKFKFRPIRKQNFDTSIDYLRPDIMKKETFKLDSSLDRIFKATK